MLDTSNENRNELNLFTLFGLSFFKLVIWVLDDVGNLVSSSYLNIIIEISYEIPYFMCHIPLDDAKWSHGDKCVHDFHFMIWLSIRISLYFEHDLSHHTFIALNQ